MNRNNGNLLDYLRHRPPMVLLDSVIEIGDVHAVTEVCISPASAFFSPESGVPGWVGIEYMAQTVAVLAGSRACDEGEPVAVGYLLGTRKYVSRVACFETGQRLRISCNEQLIDGNGLGAYNCRIEENGLLAEARLTVYKKPANV